MTLRTHIAMADPPANARPRKTRQYILTGLICVFLGVAMLFSPALLGRGIVSAAIAGVGFLCASVGLNMIFHAAWDARKGK